MKPSAAVRWLACGLTAGMALATTFTAIAGASAVVGAGAIANWLIAFGLLYMNLETDFPG